MLKPHLLHWNENFYSWVLNCIPKFLLRKVHCRSMHACVYFSIKSLLKMADLSKHLTRSQFSFSLSNDFISNFKRKYFFSPTKLQNCQSNPKKIFFLFRWIAKFFDWRKFCTQDSLLVKSNCNYICDKKKLVAICYLQNCNLGQ